MGYLIDTNVLSEMRKGARANLNVQAWVARYMASEVFLSALVVGEIRRGIEIVRRKDSDQAEAIERWLTTVTSSFGDRILPVTRQIAEEWGRLSVPDPVPVIDGLLAATARVHSLTLVTRNVKDVARTGVPIVNPFEPLPAS